MTNSHYPSFVEFDVLDPGSTMLKLTERGITAAISQGPSPGAFSHDTIKVDINEGRNRNRLLRYMLENGWNLSDIDEEYPQFTQRSSDSFRTRINEIAGLKEVDPDDPQFLADKALESTGFVFNPDAIADRIWDVVNDEIGNPKVVFGSYENLKRVVGGHVSTAMKGIEKLIATQSKKNK